MPEPLLHLLYTSIACEPFTQADLRALLEQSRRFNAVHAVTGLLLYHNEAFMQLLEGPPAVVRELYYDHIECDPRHRAIEPILERPTDMRLFPDWSMGFRLPGADTHVVPEGFRDVFDTGGLGAVAAGEPNALLQALARFRDEPSLF